MRKRYKLKKRSCGLCKPHKMRGAKRWKDKESIRLYEFEKLKNEYQDIENYTT